SRFGSVSPPLPLALVKKQVSEDEQGAFAEELTLTRQN
ncbi:MAG: hypothetical protein H6P98_2046, partial [Candidatus Aminicenantes bacterium]|nr:hypothetical protein [Candidatus Aminicenantes bacterium]